MPADQQTKLTPQEAFDTKYITAAEVARQVGVTRPALLYAIKNNKIPQPIIAGETGMHLWERETMTPFLEVWKNVINFRKGGAQ